MRFDVVIGNPPYQEDTGGMVPKEMYSKFAISGDALRSDIISMIIPTRWFNGTTEGFVTMRNTLLNSGMKDTVIYEKAAEVFPGTQISGGICYFNHSKNYSGKCKVNQIYNGKSTIDYVELTSTGFVVSNLGRSIINKIIKHNRETNNVSLIDMVDTVFTCCNFGLQNPDEIAVSKEIPDSIWVKTGKGHVYVESNQLSETGYSMIDKYKIICGIMVPGGGQQKSDQYGVISTPVIINPGQAASNAYMVLGAFDTKEIAENFLSYVKTKLFRFLVFITVNSTSMNSKNYIYIPFQDFNKQWKDEELFEIYQLNADEIELINYRIKSYT